MKGLLFLCVASLLFQGIAKAEEVVPCYSHLPIRQFAVPSKPGFTTAFSQNGLNYFKNVGLQVLEKDLGHIAIPSIAGTVGVAVIGNIGYSISNIHINKFDFQQSKIAFVPGTGLRVTLTQSTADGGLNWHYRRSSWPHISGSGTADISVKLSADILIGLQEINNHLQISSVVPSINIEKLDISLHGGASWLYQFFVDVLHGTIVKGIDKALTNALQKQIEDGINKTLMKVPIRQLLLDAVVFDIGLVRNPLFQQDTLTLYEAGDSYVTASPTSACPDDQCPQRDLPSTMGSEMVTMYLSDYVPKSLVYALIQAGKVKYDVETSLIPSSSPFKLNTNSLAGSCPPLYAAYPGRNVSLVVALASLPQIVFTPQGAVIPSAPVSIEFYVETNNTKILAFTLSGNINTTASAALNGWTLTAKIGPISATWAVSQSSIGTVDPKPLGSLLKFATGVGLPIINKKLSSGIQLPTAPGLQFVNPSLVWGQNWLSVRTDLSYVLSK